MTNPATDQHGRKRYEQPRGAYLRTRVFLGFVFVIILVGTVGGTISSVQWLLSSPSTPRANWLLPLVLALVFLQFLFWAGPEVFRRRFAVFDAGFVPPYRRAGAARITVSPFIPFGDVERIVANTLHARGREIVSQVAAEFRGGDRIVMSTSDIGGIEGVAALHEAWREYQARVPLGSIRPTTQVWAGRELRWNLAFSFSLVFTMSLMAVFVVFGIGAFSVATLAVVSIAMLGIVFAVGYAWRALRVASSQNIVQVDVEQAGR